MRTNSPLLQQKVIEPLGEAWPEFRQIAALRKADPEPLVFLHPVDAKKERFPMETGFGCIHPSDKLR